MEATTTTVPLRESIEDRGGSHDPVPGTPRRRGRPRKSNGTPMPSAAKRKRQVSGTPVKATPTPKRTKARKPSQEPQDTSSHPSGQGTPTPKRRGRPRKNPSVEPSSETGLEGMGSKRGKKRRQALVPEDFVEIVEELAEEASIHEEDELDLVPAPSETPRKPLAANPTPPPESNADDDDIWMATLSDQATPRPARQESPVADSITVATDEDVQEATEELALVDEAALSEVSESENLEAMSVRNGDTVAQEDFSMIFMDSIPSLRASLNQGNVTLTPHEFGEETSYIINKTLEDLRNGGETLEPVEEEHVSPEPSAAPTAVAHEEETGVSKFQNRRISLSPALIRSALKSRTPRRNDVSPLRRRLLQSASRRPGHRFEQVEEQEDEEEEASMIDDPMARTASKNPFSARVNIESSRAFEDSFSEVPDAVLTAATPAPALQQLDVDEDDENTMESDQMLEDDVAQEEDQPLERIEEDEDEEAQLLHEAEEEEQVDEEPELEGHDVMDTTIPSNRSHRTASNASLSIRSDASRLPTPDDTPPSHEQTNDAYDIEKTATSSHAASSPGPSSAKSLADAHVRSPPIPQIVEPPPVSEAPHVSTNFRMKPMERTPVHQISSPAQEPGSLAPESAQDRSRRPTLSPIVRAGRVLQSITSDPPSPEPQEPHLRSPFRSSTTKDHGSVDKIISSARMASASPRRPFSFPQAKPPAPVASFLSRLDEDPFTSTGKVADASSFAQSLRRSLIGSPEKGRPESRESVANSVRISHPGDDMSWVAEAGPISPRLRGDNSLRDISKGVAPSLAASRETEPEPAPAQSTSSPAAQIEEDENDDDVDEVEDAEDLEIDGDEEIEEAEDSDKADDQVDDDETDIWEVEAQRDLPKPARQQPFGHSLAPGRRRGIPSPWTKQPPVVPSNSRSVSTKSAGPAEDEEAERIIADETDEFSMIGKRTAVESGLAAAESTAQKKSFDLSAFFSSPAAIPGILASKTMSLLSSKQKTNVEDADASSSNIPATLPTNSLFPAPRQQTSRPSMASRSKAASPLKRQPNTVGDGEGEEEHDDDDELAELQSSPQQTPSKLGVPLHAMKKSFAPRPREQNQLNQSFFHSPPKQAAAPSVTPARMQMTHSDIQRWQQEAQKAGKESPELARPLLRPLPPRNASPTKSSLRSPLKARTPGRVVEFTSSVLSVADQARVRAERRMSNASNGSRSSGPPSLTQPRPIPQPRAEANKENQDVSDIVMTDASPVGKEPVPEPLSRTVWTRRHWLFLDELLHLRRQGVFEIGYERQCEKLLGKTVKSQGESMRLERWHLDCVDAFRAEVGGWDESVLAKRLFALLLGEDRRSRNTTERQSTVMFH